MGSNIEAKSVDMQAEGSMTVMSAEEMQSLLKEASELTISLKARVGNQYVDNVSTLINTVTSAQDAYNNATAGQTVTVTANITGPDKDTVNISWGYSMSGGYSGSLPTTTATSISCKSNTSGKVVITSAPNTTKRVNGEDLIVGSVQINVIYQ